ncbi:hypothetical protein HDU96_002683, partial [Phlyctochytrium bullatum]
MNGPTYNYYSPLERLQEEDELELEMEQDKKMKKAQSEDGGRGDVGANNYAASVASTQEGKSNSDDSKVDDVITHTEVLISVLPEKKEKQIAIPDIDVELAPYDDGMLVNAEGLPGVDVGEGLGSIVQGLPAVVVELEPHDKGVGSTPGTPQEKKRNHGVPPDAKLRQPTTHESDKYQKINVGTGKRNQSAKLIDDVDDVKAIITVLCVLEACLRWMIVAYFLTVLLAADYYLEKLAKESYLPKCLVTTNITRSEPDEEVDNQIREFLASINGVKADNVEELYVDLVNELIDLPERKVKEFENEWPEFLEYLEWLRSVTSLTQSNESAVLEPPSSSDFCERRMEALHVILKICIAVYGLCSTGRGKGSSDVDIMTKLKNQFLLPAALEGGAAKARKVCKGILRKKSGGEPESDDENEGSNNMVILTCPPKESYNHSNVPGASDGDLHTRFNGDQALIWKSLEDGKFVLRFVWCKAEKPVSFRKLFKDIKATLFPKLENRDDPKERLRSHSKMLRAYWGYALQAKRSKEGLGPKTRSHPESTEPNQIESESLEPRQADAESMESMAETVATSQRAVSTSIKGKEAAHVDNPKPGNDKNAKQGRSPGIEETTKVLLGSIQTVFVLQERDFMKKFGELFGEYAGCELGSDLLEAVRKSVKEEIDGWNKAPKYTWTSIVQHPMMLRLFPNGDEKTPLIRMNPDGKYVIEPVPLQVQARDMNLIQLKKDEFVTIGKEQKKNNSIRPEKDEKKLARLTGAEFGVHLSSVPVTFLVGFASIVTVPKDNRIKRTWGTARLVVNKNDEIVLTIPFKLEGCGRKIKKEGKCRKHSKPQEKPVTNPRRADPEEEILLSEEDYPFEFY